MKLNANTKVIDGKEIKYFINEKGANIQIVKVEPNRFGDWWGYSTIDVCVNIYNDDFSRRVSFLVEGFNTGVTGESWFDDEDEDNNEEVTEEDAWERTLDYFSPDDPYDTWLNETELLNSFNKYCEEYDDDTDLMYDMMVDEKSVKNCCFGEDCGVSEFEIIKPFVDYSKEESYTDDNKNISEIPIYVGVNKPREEREAVKQIKIDKASVEKCISIYAAYKVLDSEDPNEYKKTDYYLGEWLTDMKKQVKPGSLICEACLGKDDLPEWDDEHTIKSLRFWKLTDIHKTEIQGKTYTVFCSGCKSWRFNDEKVEEGLTSYPMLFTDDIEEDFSIELFAKENNLPLNEVKLMYKAAEWYVDTVYTNCFDERESSDVRWIKKHYKEWEIDYYDVIDQLSQEDCDKLYELDEKVNNIEESIKQLVEKAWKKKFSYYYL